MSDTSLPQEDPALQSRVDPSTYYRVVLGTAIVAGVFSLLVTSLLLAGLSRRTAKDPFEAIEFKQLKAELAENPTSEPLKEEIRELDLRLRREHFGHRRFTAWGGVLLLAGLAVTLACGKWAAVLRREMPQPGDHDPPQNAESQVNELARFGVAGLAGLLIGIAIVATLGFPTLIPEEIEALASAGEGLGAAQPVPGGQTAPKEKPLPVPRPKETPAANPFAKDADREPGHPTEEENAKYWTRFRGPGGAGVSAYPNAPTSWDDKSGKGIVWKTPVPLGGFSSPIVWKDRVFLSGGTAERRVVYCFDANSGELLWRKEAPGTPESTAKFENEPEFTGYAAPTMATDGRRVFATFANGDVVAFDMAGNLVWSRSLGIPENHYGHASSLEMFENLLLVQIDQGRKKDGKSKIRALDNLTGKTVWEQARPVDVSWGTPAVVRHDGKPLLLTASTPWVIAYRPKDGSEVWRVDCMEGENGVSPIYRNGMVQVGNEYCRWSAVRADGQGDVTKTHVVWTSEDNLPDQCCALATDKYVFLLQTYGLLTCHDAKSGKNLWEQEFEGAQFTSSPGMAAGRLYLFGEVDTDEEDADGNYIRHCTAWIVEPGDTEGKILQECKLEEGCVTSPAFQDGRIYIRGRKHLFCLGEK